MRFHFILKFHCLFVSLSQAALTSARIFIWRKYIFNVNFIKMKFNIGLEFFVPNVTAFLCSYINPQTTAYASNECRDFSSNSSKKGGEWEECIVYKQNIGTLLLWQNHCLQFYMHKNHYFFYKIKKCYTIIVTHLNFHAVNRIMPMHQWNNCSLHLRGVHWYFRFLFFFFFLFIRLFPPWFLDFLRSSI